MSAAAKPSANDNALVLQWPAELLDQAAAGVRRLELPSFSAPELEQAPVREPASVTPGTDEYRRAARAHHEEMAGRFRHGTGSTLPGRLSPYDLSAIACTCAYCFGPCGCRSCSRLRARLRRGGR